MQAQCCKSARRYGDEPPMGAEVRGLLIFRQARADERAKPEPLDEPVRDAALARASMLLAGSDDAEPRSEGLDRW